MILCPGVLVWLSPCLSIIVLAWAAWQESKQVQQVKWWNTKASMHNNKEDLAPPVNDTHFSPLHILILISMSLVQFLLISPLIVLVSLIKKFFCILFPDDSSVSLPSLCATTCSYFPLLSLISLMCVSLCFFFKPETMISTSCVSPVWITVSKDRPK